MKHFFYIIIVSLILISFSNSSVVERKGEAVSIKENSSLVLKAIFKGTYVNFSNENRDTYYLAEVNLINNTDSICEFITHTCYSAINYIISPKGYSILGHWCSGDSERPIKLKPNQVFSSPIIFCITDSFDYKDYQVRFGFILLTPKALFSQYKDSWEVWDSLRKNQTNVIWSEPITRESVTQSLDWDIRQIINDTTYSVLSSK
jgi:hypothetical protein